MDRTNCFKNSFKHRLHEKLMLGVALDFFKNHHDIVFQFMITLLSASVFFAKLYLCICFVLRCCYVLV